MDEPAHRLSDPSAADAWLRWFWLWDAYFAMGFVATCALLLAGDDAPPARELGAIAVLAVIGAAYAIFGRRAILGDNTGRAKWFAAGVVLLLTAAVTIDGNASFALFAVIPLVFMSLELKYAIPVVVVVNLVPPVSVLIRDGTTSLFNVLGPGSLVGIMFAVVIGTWIHRIVVQSEGRATLIAELERSREEVGRLSREAGVAAERSRLAAEIHDTLAQGFTSLLTLVQAAESELDSDRGKARRHLELAARTARENLGEARALVAGLMPSAMGTGSLDEAIARQVDRLVEETGIRADYRIEGDHRDLPTAIEVVLLRAVQESLTNVRKHSGAREVSICLRVTESTATLRVIDDGCGFDPAAAGDGFGLQGMRNRVAQIGGELTVHSGAETGTTVELEVAR